MARTMPQAAALLLAMLSASAVAEPWPEPAMPSGPMAVEQASDWLDYYWRSCRNEAYPEPVEVSSEKLGVTLRFARAGRKLTGSLAIELADKSSVPPAAVRRFASCVNRRFASRRFVPYSVDLASRYSLFPPGAEDLVDPRSGVLRPGPARDYVNHEVEKLRGPCRSGKAGAGPWTITMTAEPDGTPSEIAVEGAPPATARCLQRKLAALRFPRSTEALPLMVKLAPRIAGRDRPRR